VALGAVDGVISEIKLQVPSESWAVLAVVLIDVSATCKSPKN
jgi:hypothetical protein